MTLPYTVPLALGIGSGVMVGRNSGSPVSTTLRTTVRVHRQNRQVTVDLTGKLIPDSTEEKHAQAKVADGAPVSGPLSSSGRAAPGAPTCPGGLSFSDRLRA